MVFDCHIFLSKTCCNFAAVGGDMCRSITTGDCMRRSSYCTIACNLQASPGRVGPCLSSQTCCKSMDCPVYKARDRCKSSHASHLMHTRTTVKKHVQRADGASAEPSCHHATSFALCLTTTIGFFQNHHQNLLPKERET